MSRRKQARPIRVFESEDGLEHTQVINNGEGSVTDSEDDGSGSAPRDDSICEHCHVEYTSPQQAEEHRKVCLPVKELLDSPASGNDETPITGDEEEEDGSLPEEGKRQEEVRRQKQDAENNNSVEDEAEDELPLGFPYPGHVTLEALQNTKVAVAQFAATAMANNSDNAAALQELAVLQSTLYTLQTQQMMQLNLIQQLQQQLQITQPPSPASTPILTTPVPPPPTTPTPAPSRHEASPVSTPTSQPMPASEPQPQPQPQPDTVQAAPKPSPPPLHQPSLPPCSVSSAFASSIITNYDPPPSPSEPNTLEMLQRRAQEVLDNASQGLLANNLADELAFRKNGKSMSPYDSKTGGRNEPFFKHRCRYCGKVFGSDSALQIHIRSHTGERPFKCNVCGSRFTTKGNLKVHFQRHTSKFPHIKMNPNPVPEHLDKYHPPLLAQMGAHQSLPPGVPHSPHSSSHSSHSSHPSHHPHHPHHPHHQFPGSPPYPSSGLSLFRTQHPSDLVLPPQHQSLMKPVLPMPLFGPRQDVQQHSHPDQPENLSKPTSTHSSSPPPSDHSDHFKKEIPSEDEGPIPLTMCITETAESVKTEDRLTPKTEMEGEPGRYSPLPYDECSSDSKYSHDQDQDHDQDHEELRDSPHSHGKQDHTGSPGLQDQPENLSNKMRGNTTCNICFKTFACNSALEIHYRSHTKERPFKCTICDRGFSTKGNMKQHMLTHKIRDMPSHLFEQKSPHSAMQDSNDCSNASSEGRDLSLPRAVSVEPPAPPPLQAPPPPQQPLKEQHQPPPPPQPVKRSPPEDILPLPKRQPSMPKHLCHVCNKNFSSSSALQIHMRTHTGDKPFRCTICHKAFTTKGNLKVHMGTHMWTNGASRRGRRMSLDLPPLPITNKDSDFLQRRPDLFYPYLPAPFLNGMQQKLNEISVIQNVGSTMGSNGLLGFGGYGGLPAEMKPGSPLSDKPHRATPPLWDLHYERKPPAEDHSRMDRMDCQSPPAHVPPRGEGLAA